MLFSMIFPGQGACNLYKRYKYLYLNNSNVVKNTFEEASEILKLNLWNILRETNNFNYNSKNYSYLSILTLITSVTIYRIWNTITGLNPTIMAGHSLGEYTALVCSNVIQFSKAVKIVYLREKLMIFSSKNVKGSMLTIVGLNIEHIKKIIALHFNNHYISLACINSKNNIVVSGKSECIKKMRNLCYKYGAKFSKILPINVAAHSYLMKPAAVLLHKIIKNVKFRRPTCLLVNNTSIKCETSSNFIKKSLIQQLYKPVKWIEIMKYIISKRITLFLEVGVSSILTKINKYINNVTSISLHNMNKFVIALKKIK